MMIKIIKLGLIGFGNVGQELARILIEREKDWAKKFKVSFKVVAVNTLRKGSLFNEKGIDLKRALADVAETGVFSNGNPDLAALNALELTRLDSIDVVIEVSTLNIENGQPASDHLISALKSGKNVITANKGPIAFYYHELKTLASMMNRYLLHEGTVMDGTPVFNLIRETLIGCEISSFKGILNSTTNYILTEMAAGTKYGLALDQARKLGFVEADPALDLEGWDAAAKVAALMNVIFDARISPHHVERTGITKIKEAEIRDAEREGKTIRLMCEGYRDKNGCRGKVAPLAISLDDPLASIRGTSSAITLTTDLAGEITIESHNPQIRQTAYALISDLFAIANKYC
jgi:homoserine dehydrogenase